MVFKEGGADLGCSALRFSFATRVPQDFGMRKLALETSSTGRSSIPRGDLRATFWRERG